MDSSAETGADLLIDLWLRDSEVAGSVAELTWVADGMHENEVRVLRHLESLAGTHMELAEAVIRLPWFTEEISGDEWRVLDALRSAAEVDKEVAGMISGIPLIGESEYHIARNTIVGFTLLAQQDSSLARRVLNLPWAMDGIAAAEGDSIRALSELATIDKALAEAVLNMPWYVSGPQQIVDFEMSEILVALSRIAAQDRELGSRVASYRWFNGSINSNELSFLKGLGTNVSSSQEAAELMADLTRWIEEDTVNEWWALYQLSRTLGQEPGMVETIRGMRWLMDHVSSEELETLKMWLYIRENDRVVADKATELSWFGNGPGDFLDNRALESLYWLTRRGLASQLTSESWFADGINEEEAALLVPAGAVSYKSPDLAGDLLATQHTQTRTVSLPLGGRVRIWVFQNTPFPEGEDLVSTIEETIHMAEERMRVPFPKSEVILLVLDRSQKSYKMDVGYFHDHMRLIRKGGEVYRLPHETAHYYFNRGPSWFREGGAEFIAVHYDDWKGTRDLELGRADAARLARHCIEQDQMENIRHLLHVLSNSWDDERPKGCRYTMGESLFHELYEVMGEAATWLALGDLHRLNMGPYRDITEENIFRILLKHTPLGAEEKVREVYSALHGGFRHFPDTETRDDHGDQAANATLIKLGESVPGLLDYRFDFDYFRFEAQEGQKYRVSVHHGALRPTSIGLYAPDGTTGVNRSWITRDLTATGPRIVWVAPRTDHYYFAIHNFGGKTGPYTVAVEPVSQAPSDVHGDTQATATRLSTGDIVSGTVDDDLDIDYFRVEVVEGTRYLIKVESGTLEEFLVKAEFPGRKTRRWTKMQLTSWKYDGYRWTAKAPGTIFVGVHGAAGSTGTYRVSVSEIVN